MVRGSRGGDRRGTGGIKLVWCGWEIGGGKGGCVWGGWRVKFRGEGWGGYGAGGGGGGEGEHAFIQLMNFRVPAQTASGELLETIDYITYDGVTELQTTDAKPLINVYVYGPVIGFEDFSQSGFPGHGRREAFAAVSLDDGATWKRTNLSNSADESSFTIAEPGIPDPGVPQPEFEVTTDTEYVTTSASIVRKKLTVVGVSAPRKGQVDVRNAITHELLGSTKAKNDGSFTFKDNGVTAVPCTVQAGSEADGVWGNYLAVVRVRIPRPVRARPSRRRSLPNIQVT